MYGIVCYILAYRQTSRILPMSGVSLRSSSASASSSSVFETQEESCLNSFETTLNPKPE